MTEPSSLRSHHDGVVALVYSINMTADHDILEYNGFYGIGSGGVRRSCADSSINDESAHKT